MRLHHNSHVVHFHFRVIIDECDIRSTSLTVFRVSTSCLLSLRCRTTQVLLQASGAFFIYSIAAEW
jgi:hypothetical protein